ncbi:MAG: hypothetical protein AAFR73_13245 [Pseudomonadota bacterium]
MIWSGFFVSGRDHKVKIDCCLPCYNLGMEMPFTNDNSHHSEPVRRGVHRFQQDWMSVEEAVVYCAELGLTRTPKTVRKWAERSSGLPDGDVVARKQDTPWGYRWQIEKGSLTRKVDEELDLQAANEPEPVPTGLRDVASKTPEKTFYTGPTVPAQAPAGAYQFVQNETESVIENERQTSPNQPEHVPTRLDIELVLDEVRERMADKDREIGFLRQQLADAQTEIGKRARSTDEALKTIDRVVRSFELQAEANRAAVLGAGRVAGETDVQTAAIKPIPVDNGHGHQDIRRV